MDGYLTQIKSIVNQLALAASPVDAEDLVLLILNGLPDEYNAFKTSIKTKVGLISIEELFSLLNSDSIHVKSSSKQAHTLEIPFAYHVSRTSHRGGSKGNSYRGRGRDEGRFFRENSGTQGRGDRSHNNQSQGSHSGYPSSHHSSHSTASSNTNRFFSKVICQICGKTNHSTLECWNRLDTSYQPSCSSLYQAYVSFIYSQLSTGSPSDNTNWFLDSAATSHITNYLNNLPSYQPYHGPDQVTVGNGNTLPIHHTGHGLLPTPFFPFHLSKMFRVPSSSFNLISIHQLISNNHYTITFDKNLFIIQDKSTKKVLYKGYHSHGLYHLSRSTASVAPSAASFTPVCFHCTVNNSFTIYSSSPSNWDFQLGHPSSRKFQYLVKYHLLPSLSVDVNKVCSHCCVSKSHRPPFSLSNSTVNKPLALIHTDV